jgi:hypothetical protein
MESSRWNLEPWDHTNDTNPESHQLRPFRLKHSEIANTLFQSYDLHILHKTRTNTGLQIRSQKGTGIKKPTKQNSDVVKFRT